MLKSHLIEALRSIPGDLPIAFCTPDAGREMFGDKQPPRVVWVNPEGEALAQEPDDAGARDYYKPYIAIWGETR